MPPRPREHTEMATQWKVGVTVAASLSPSSHRVQIEDDLGTTRSTPYVGSVCGASGRAAVVLGHGQRRWWCWGSRGGVGAAWITGSRVATVVLG
jgi:hypothetical protein